MYKKRKFSGGALAARPRGRPSIQPVPPPQVAMNEATEMVQSSMPILPGELEFGSSDYTWVNDSNTSGPGAYSQIMIDTLNVQLGESQWFLPSRSFVWLQQRILATTVGQKFCPLSIAFKNGFPQLDSCQVRINDGVVNNQNQYLYLINNYKLLSQWSASKSQMAGSTYMFSPPSVDACRAQEIVASYTGTTTIVPKCSNNVGIPTTFATAASIIPTAATTYGTNTAGTGTIAISNGGVVAPTGATFTAAMVGGILTVTSGTMAGSTFVITAFNDPNLQVDRTGNSMVVPAGAFFVITLPRSTLPFGDVQAGPPTFNPGLYDRLMDASFPGAWSSSKGTLGVGGSNNNTFADTSIANGIGVNTYSLAAADTVDHELYVVNVIIPLEYINDVFTTRGLSRDRIQLQIGINDVAGTSGDPANPTVALAATASCCPLIGTYEGLGKSGISNIKTQLKTKARLYLRLVTTPKIGPQMPSVVVREYMDYQLQNTIYQNQSPGQVTFQITPGIARPRMILGYFWYSPSCRPNGLSLLPTQQMTCEEPSYSSPAIYFGGPNMTIQIGTKQCFMNSIQYQFEKYFQLDINNFEGNNESKTLTSGLPQQMDYRNSQQGNILQINLAKCTIPLSFMGGMLIWVNGQLYSPKSVPVSCLFVLMYSRITRFNNATKEVTIIAA
jgi:hypothetical protein